MILIILGIAVIALYLSFIMMKSSVVRSILVTIFGAITIVSLLLINMNDVQHYGMKKETVETTKPSTLPHQMHNCQCCSSKMLGQAVSTMCTSTSYLLKARRRIRRLITIFIIVFKPALLKQQLLKRRHATPTRATSIKLIHESKSARIG